MSRIQQVQKVLLSFNGVQDPYQVVKGAEHGMQKDGPILNLVAEMKDFTRVLLFSTVQLTPQAQETARLIKARNPSLDVTLCRLELEDPTNYEAILPALRPKVAELCPADPMTEYFISVSSGTSQMHACWLLLAASGEIPAHILHIRERQHVKEGQPLITEVNPRSEAFPLIRQNIMLDELPDISREEMIEAVKEVGIIGHHPKLRSALETAAQAAPHALSVLILGESGTGKELFARYIHRISKRRLNPFVPVNCSAIPAELIESELFGYVPGAFSGALNRVKKGLFDAANGGTLFLDEIGEMLPETQAVLLRVLEEKKFRRVGAVDSVDVDVRIIAATNKDLREGRTKGYFRTDLYYRLATITLSLPSLRERKEDIPAIALKFLDDFNKKYQKNKQITADGLAFLQNRPWEGNIRELRNLLEQVMVTSRVDKLDAEALKQASLQCSDGPSIPEPHEGFSLDSYLAELRGQLLSRALELSRGDLEKAAKLLGTTLQTFRS